MPGTPKARARACRRPRLGCLPGPARDSPPQPPLPPPPLGPPQATATAFAPSLARELPSLLPHRPPPPPPLPSRCVTAPCVTTPGPAPTDPQRTSISRRQDDERRTSPTSNEGNPKDERCAGRKSDSLVVCEVDPELKERLRKFRFRKETDNAAIIMKVDKDRQMVVLEEEFQNISPEELKMELPERQPRTFVVYSYKYVHEDGRLSYPLCFIFSSPVGCKPEQQMMYAGSKNRLVQTAELTKVFEIRTTDDLTETWLKEKLSFFR
ncbi:glia maturation factor gamma [Orycteropus afer afer]|uniref:Glia maturation factor gamma n=1 Tax=Orycteropus afer afer TaxID=1230840 RepID=A0AC54Z7T8_ORYAF|nr:glia maturation factor gamma [Orycteropus afer afer]